MRVMEGDNGIDVVTVSTIGMSTSNSMAIVSHPIALTEYNIPGAGRVPAWWRLKCRANLRLC